MGNLKDLESHFEFGKNWEHYSEIINEERIEEAKRGLERLVPREELEGKSFLDIGCGSGLHSLAALRLGASRIEAVDIDPRSVGTTKALLSRYAGNTSINVRQVSIFDLPASCSFEFDVVYSWGVLHHTGAMREAIRVASEFVKKGGVFTFALYRKTWTCRLWALEKRWYASASPKAQKRARSVFIALNRIVFALPLRGGSFRAFLEGYGKNRGMDFHIDLHDWMGGYPYESIAPNEVEDLMGEMGFQLERRYLVSDSFSSRLGVFGSGNDEYVYRKK